VNWRDNWESPRGQKGGVGGRDGEFTIHGRLAEREIHATWDKTGRRHYNRINDRSLTSADTQLKSHHRSVRQCDSEKCGETPLHFSYDIDGPKVPPSGIVLYATPTESNVLAEKKY
jgi:hypothetical protein